MSSITTTTGERYLDVNAPTKGLAPSSSQNDHTREVRLQTLQHAAGVLERVKDGVLHKACREVVVSVTHAVPKGIAAACLVGLAECDRKQGAAAKAQ